MLNTMRAATKAAYHITTLVNTHSNGDHCNGNQLIENARRITSIATAREMEQEPSPAVLGQMILKAPAHSSIRRTLGSFQFTPDIQVPAPTDTFSGETMLMVGSKQVHLLEVGPAHTLGDTLVYIPSDRVVFTGDILFIGSHPVMWAGPTKNWLRACERILEMDVETIVPGHGPLTDKHGVREVKDYLQYVYQEARLRYQAGMSAYDAARDISLDRFAHWQDGERIVPNIDTMYREFQGQAVRPSVHLLFQQMDQFLNETRDKRAPESTSKKQS